MAKLYLTSCRGWCCPWEGPAVVWLAQTRAPPFPLYRLEVGTSEGRTRHTSHTYSGLQCLVMLVWRWPWTGAGEGPDIATIIRDIIITSMIYENHFVVFVRYNVCRHCPPSLRGDYKDWQLSLCLDSRPSPPSHHGRVCDKAHQLCRRKLR